MPRNECDYGIMSHADGCLGAQFEQAFHRDEISERTRGNPELLRKMGAGNALVGGRFLCCVIEGERDVDVGKVVNRGGVQPW